ncbi:hypothetical protein AGABI2DRAFT_139604 [Agaricus bisporus var. bisporus H97]|uniref:hypothetical protein n=1 Tax=Agaricus bisporus var. bisporus (strain H97 / ATCC MYA-4626 / FGSC 10389) TaxID=936046 RepID=UPI00029F679C|nr:hypothetical protein AGABI2DRAFT_139604 [Agaricus bisporus var. bisporus H97]EKV42226.1 hypothetical protein AGABI2DRAFT_139604 [Agaricus bisporus var. bisporus H97]
MFIRLGHGIVKASEGLAIVIDPGANGYRHIYPIPNLYQVTIIESGTQGPHVQLGISKYRNV